MGRQVSDGRSVDVTAPAGVITKDELYRIANFTGFAMASVAASDTERGLALNLDESVYSVKVPADTCGTVGGYVKWSTNDGSFAKGDTHIANESSAYVKTALTVAQVVAVRNSGGYAQLKLVRF